MPDSYRTCSVEGCERKHDARGLCSNHRQQLKLQTQTILCSIEGCNRPSHTRSYCQYHYNRLKKDGILIPIAKASVLCSVNGCNRKHRAHGLCSMHSGRMARNGSVEINYLQQSIEFIRQTVANPPAECVKWPYGKTKGYGKLQYQKKIWWAHRLSLSLFTGENPEHLLALHGRCHDRACINPLHLRWGTQKENIHDKVLDGTSNRGERHLDAKLTENDVRIIKERIETESCSAIAKSFNVTSQAINHIKKGKSWGWLK